MTQCFYIIRHVNSEVTNKYWRIAYKQIRKFYDDHIFIVDDNSTLSQEELHMDMENATVIQSEFPPQRAELLPYYYFHRDHPADKAIIIHDSIFLHAPIPNLENVVEYQPLFDFKHNWDHVEDQVRIIKRFVKPQRLVNIHAQKKRWKGMFGVMSVVEWSYLNKVEQRHQFFKILLEEITSRYHRMSLERILGLLLSSFKRCSNPPIYGDVHTYFGTIAFKQDLEMYTSKESYLNIEKVWSGR